jgi:transposase
VNVDYHVDAAHHYYSVPYALIQQQLDIRLSATTVEVFQRATRVWVHRRSATVGGYTTVPEHMPHAHRAHLKWSPSRLIRWGATVGPQTEALVQQILASRPHAEQGYRSCLGLLRLAKKYGPERVEVAHQREAVHVRGRAL